MTDGEDTHAGKVSGSESFGEAGNTHHGCQLREELEVELLLEASEAVGAQHGRAACRRPDGTDQVRESTVRLSAKESLHSCGIRHVKRVRLHGSRGTRGVADNLCSSCSETPRVSPCERHSHACAHAGLGSGLAHAGATSDEEHRLRNLRHGHKRLGEGGEAWTDLATSVALRVALSSSSSTRHLCGIHASRSNAAVIGWRTETAWRP